MAHLKVSASIAAKRTKSGKKEVGRTYVPALDTASNRPELHAAIDTWLDDMGLIATTKKFTVVVAGEPHVISYAGKLYCPAKAGQSEVAAFVDAFTQGLKTLHGNRIGALLAKLYGNASEETPESEEEELEDTL